MVFMSFLALKVYKPVQSHMHLKNKQQVRGLGDQPKNAVICFLLSLMPGAKENSEKQEVVLRFRNQIRVCRGQGERGGEQTWKDGNTK